MKYLLYDLWTNIKKSPFLFIFLFVQIAITSMIFYTVLANYYWIKEENQIAQVAWGDKEYAQLFPKTNVSHYQRMALMFSSEKMLNPPEEELQKNIEKLDKVEEAFNLFKQIDGLEMIVNQENWDITILEPKQWEDEDKKYSDYDLFRDTGNDKYDVVNGLWVGSEYLDYFKVKLSEGKYFSEEDHLYDGDYIPVIMGSKYKKYYTLGEEFEAYLGATSNISKLKVIGFVAENQYYSPVNRASMVQRYDNQIILPYINRNHEELHGDYKAYHFLYTSRIGYTFYITAPEDYARVSEQINDVLKQTGLDENYELRKLRTNKMLSSNYKDQLMINVIVCVLTFIFSLFTLVFTMLYKVDNNMKTYAVYMVVGETYNEIIRRILFETFTVFLLGEIFGFIGFKIFAVNSFIYRGYNYIEAPTIGTGLIFNLIFYIIAVIVLFICVNMKVRSYSISALIRGREVKKERSLPFYRVVLFVMLAIVSVFSMFISSYQTALNRMDLYYTGYHSKNVRMAYVTPLATEENPEVDLNFGKIRDRFDDIIINKYIASRAESDDTITERGIYFNGYIEPLNMIYGRFMTPEESSREGTIAVVGKGIYEKYVTFNENNEPFYYSPETDKTLKVIGVIGKEDAETNLDFDVFIPMHLASLPYGEQGTYTLDAKDAETIAELELFFTEHASETANVTTTSFPFRIPIEAPTDLLFLLLVMIVINATVFCFYYVSRQGSIHFIKKLARYSTDMILIDTFIDFGALAVLAYIVGNAIIVLLKNTVCKDVQLFSIYMLDLNVIMFSLSTVILLAIGLTVIAIAKTFTAGNYNKYRN